jgi:hypothetical protein
MNLKELRKKKTELDKQLEQNSKEAIVTEFKAFFEKHPRVTGVRWSQYTPYFMDGDPCVFGKNEFRVQTEGSRAAARAGQEPKEDDPEYDEDGFLETYTQLPDPFLNEDVKALEATFDNSDELFEIAFGDHVEVTVTKDGFEVTECEHD